MSSPPTKPLMIYDGGCRFCTLWIRRWKHVTGEQVDYLPFQDQRIAKDFPELPRKQCEAAVQLIETDGTIFGAAEAAFRALGYNPSARWLLDWYEHSPLFASLAEWGYRRVAGNRRLFSALTRIGWGNRVEPSEYIWVRWWFLRLVGVIYLIAFLSVWVQILGLVGANGIMPARMTVAAWQAHADAQKIGFDRYHLLPTLCWISASDNFLKAQCAAGTALALLLIFGIAPAPCLFLLWLVYLSLCVICREFLGFQWDVLLLETGFLAIFFAPFQILPRAPRTNPSRIVLFLIRWLLFRLMFESGVVKLSSGDSTWRELTALNFHYETQPLPTWIGWYAHQLPSWSQKSSTAVMFIIELVIPFLIFAPRRPRYVAAAIMIAFQISILLTGNYCFFNLLTILLSLPLFDDDLLRRSWKAVRARVPGLRSKLQVESCKLQVDVSPGHDLQPATCNLQPSSHDASRITHHSWPRQITIPLATVTLAISVLHFFETFKITVHVPQPILAVYEWLAPFRSLNSYGLFRVMTTNRFEIIVEGSNDGEHWLAYEFKYKPGDERQRPRFVEPHQPRLDWQMWFAALSNFQYNPWFGNFAFRLLDGSPQVLKLLKHNPFPDVPPRYLRAMLYEYRFTDWPTRCREGKWWRRELKRVYLPPASLNRQPVEPLTR